VNGFGLGLRLGSDRATAIYTLNRLRSVFTRLLAGWKLGSAQSLIDLATKSLKTLTGRRPVATPAAWMQNIRANTRFVDEVLELVGARDALRISDRKDLSEHRSLRVPRCVPR
jgi:hypothetical protein